MAATSVRFSLSAIGIEDGVFMRGEQLAPLLGFRGTIKQRPQDFIVNEIDTSGQVVTVSNFDLPSTPAAMMAPPSPLEQLPITAETQDEGIIFTAETVRQRRWRDDQRNDQSQPTDQQRNAGHVASLTAPSATIMDNDIIPQASCTSASSWTERLLTIVGEDRMNQLATLNVSAKCSSPVVDTTTEAGARRAEPSAVRIPVGSGGDKAARALLHRAVQETFPFVKTETEKGEGGAVTVVCSRAPLHPKLRELLSPEDVEKLQRLANRGSGGEGVEKGTIFAAENDRERRTLLHRAIAEAFPYLQTKTSNDPETNQQRVSAFWGRRRPGQKRKRNGPDRGEQAGTGCGRGRARRSRAGSAGDGHHVDRPVRFALRKEGKEHNRVAAALAKVLHVPVSALSFAGIKDKMAETTQVCVAQGVTPADILASNGSIAGVTVGNVSFCDRPLRLGELSGNRFSIVVRGANVSAAVLAARVADVGRGGFVNFFGTQRIGSPASAARGEVLSHQIGRDVLRGDWKGAVDKILSPRASDPDCLRSALMDRQEGRIGAKECAVRVRASNRLSIERLVLQGLVRYGDESFQAAIQCVPYGARTMWVHAYQSYVWNSMASARIRLLGRRAVPGDVVVLCGDNPHTTGDTLNDGFVSSANRSRREDSGRVSSQGDKSQETAVHGSTKESTNGREDNNSGVSLMDEDTRRGHNSTASMKETVSILTAQDMEAFASEGVTSEDLFRQVVLPLPGTTVEYPTHQVGIMYKEHLQEDRVDPSMWQAHADSAVSASNTSASGVPISHDSSTQQALTAGADHTAEGDVDSPARGLRTVSASGLVPKGAYRRIVCVPADISWVDAACPLGDSGTIAALPTSNDGSGECVPTGTRPDNPDKSGRIGILGDVQISAITTGAATARGAISVIGVAGKGTSGDVEPISEVGVLAESDSSRTDAARLSAAGADGSDAGDPCGDPRGQARTHSEVVDIDAGRSTAVLIHDGDSASAYTPRENPAEECNTGENLRAEDKDKAVQGDEHARGARVHTAAGAETDTNAAGPAVGIDRAEKVVRDVRLSFTLPPGSFATMCLREAITCNFDVLASRRDGVVENISVVQGGPPLS